MMLFIGSRVMVKHAYRSKGFTSGKGGWKWEERSGTVTHVNRKSVWVSLDHPKYFVDLYPLDRVRLIDPPTE